MIHNNYYHKMIIKDYNGNLLSEETGALSQAADGTWWISQETDQETDYGYTDSPAGFL